MNTELSVVIPCLNEEKTIGTCVKKACSAFSKLSVPGEVVVVDNGSTDRSVQIAKEAGARVIHHHPRGYGSALKRGIREALGTYVVMGDGDDTYDFSDIGEFIRLLREGADFVMGNRFGGKIHPNAMPRLHRWVGTPILTWHLNLFFNTKVSDVNCGLRGFRKEAIEKIDLRSDGMEFASEMFVKAAREKLVIKETPIDYYAPPLGRTSHLHSFRDGWRHLRFMLVLCPKYLFIFPGIVLSLIGLLSTVLLHFKTVYVLGLPLGISSATLASALLFTGMQVTLFGICAIVLNGSRGLSGEDKIEDFFRKYFTLERGLFTGGVIFFIGIVMLIGTLARIFHVANNLPYVDVPLARFAIFSIFVVLLGLQIIFSSFYISLFNLSKTLN